MLRTRWTLLLIAFIFPAMVFAQEDAGNPIEKRGYYRSHVIYGAYAHTLGLGGYFRKGWRKTGYSSTIFNIEFCNVKHPKEFKSRSYASGNIRSFFYGKENSLGFIRPSYGWQKTLFDKEVEKGVRVSYNFMFGPTVALLKPTYVSVNYPDVGSVTERYDYEKHNIRVIEGRAPFIKGIFEIEPRLGLNVKYALTFEYSKDDETIKALETGVNFDGFLREMPLMANTYNNQFFLTLYLSYHFGKRNLHK